jgi:cob(I)alamin adenosyltransferase
MRAYGRHVFICIHGDCAGPEEGLRLRQRFLELNRVYGLNKLSNPARVKCSIADCLGVCSGGPIMVVYPDGIWYHHVDLERLDRIYQEHILGGRPVEAYIFHRLYPAGQEPAYAPGLRAAANQESQSEDEVSTGQSYPAVQKPAQASTPVSTPGRPPQAEIEAASKQESGSGGQALAGNAEAEEVRVRVRQARKKKGLVIVNTGNGKGKTTAALGVMTRAWGRKMRVGVIQFLKNENARFGEIKAAGRMGDIDWISTGDGWTWTSKDMDETEARARHGWQLAQARISGGEYDLFIMDEFTYPLHYGWLDTAEVIAWLKAHKPDKLHLIITGRYAPEALIEYADLVTEMREIKHPFREQGIRAQAGIEY